MKPSYAFPWAVAVLGHALLAWAILAWPRKAEPGSRPDFVAENGLVPVSLVDGWAGSGRGVVKNPEDGPEEALNARPSDERAEISAHPISVTRATFRLMMASFSLSAEDRTNPQFGVEFIDVATDGTTRIRALETGEILSAKPQECFGGGPFGAMGLELIWSSAREQKAGFARTWCEAVEEP